jgi:putative membrane protein
MIYQDWMQGPWGLGMGIFSFLFMLAFLVLAIIGIVLLLRWLWSQGRSPSAQAPPAESPLDILKRRYARGEIDKEEFKAKLKDLSE